MPRMERRHLVLGDELLGEIAEVADREYEGNVSLATRQLVREALAARARKAPRRGPAAAARAR